MELDYFNGKLIKENLTRLVVRLKMLQRNIGLKGKNLENHMCDPLLLDVLKRRVQKFLLKLEAFWRARRPKEKKKQAIHKNSTWKLPSEKRAELSSQIEVEEENKSSQIDGGRIMLINGHLLKLYKENFKPP